ncbi:MAG: hypothetical protein COB53_04055 [Elusimicrobia bacterium]|nr:MAG: hypothetical protein COB53_04055 [Elusimicrobiota bacterium]
MKSPETGYFKRFLRLCGQLLNDMGREEPSPQSTPPTPEPAKTFKPILKQDPPPDKIKDLEAENTRLREVLNNSMDPFVAQMRIEGTLQNEKRRASVMFADLVSFTSTTENMPPESVVEDIDLLFSAMEPVLKRFRGHLDKYMGDGLMAEFGAPFGTRNHALMAVLAAIRIQERMADWEFGWKMRIGVASGPMLVGLLGSGSRKSYTAVGDKVNLASRLQTLCTPGSIYIDEDTYNAVNLWVKIRRVRVGLSPKDAEDFEARLAFLREAVEHAPTAQLCSEAANICSELGDMKSALQYHRQVLELDPQHRGSTERAISAALMTGEDRAFLTIKGKKERVAVYEVLGLNDLVRQQSRVPIAVSKKFQELLSEVGVPEEWVLSIEAVEGTIGHAAVTAALSASLAKEIGLDNKQIRMAFLTAYLHDVGKMNVPEHLLNFDGMMQDLPKSDQSLIRRHVEFSVGVLKKIKVPVAPEVLEGIIQHHENLDGTGYPKGLKGKAINIFSRILKIADTYETLTAWRPYQDAWTASAALTEITREINRQHIDPEIGEAFLRMMGNSQAGGNLLIPPTVKTETEDPDPSDKTSGG